MKIRCKGTKKFHLNINIEDYYKSIKKMGLDISLPLRIEIPCQRCKMIEFYDIYPDHYEHVKSYKQKKN